jgi:hypothetical protein
MPTLCRKRKGWATQLCGGGKRGVPGKRLGQPDGKGGPPAPYLARLELAIDNWIPPHRISR